MSTSLLTTKFFIPPIRPSVVARPRLTLQLNEALHHKLILVSAPAGFGKTTLLSGWNVDRERLDPKVRVAWLSLDEGDNDLTRFLTYAIAALQTINADIAKGALRALQSSQPPPTETGVSFLS